MLVLVKRKSLHTIIVLDKLYTGHKWLKFRPPPSPKEMHFSTSGDILLDEHIRLIFQMLYTYAVSGGKKYSFSSLCNQNKNPYRIIFFLLNTV